MAHQEALAHRQFFEAIPFPHLSMTFLEVSVLKTTPERTVREYYDVELSDWYRRLERRYAEARNLELKLVSERCFRPLRDRLEAVGGKTLGEYIREAGKLRPLFEAKDIVAGWRSEIRRALGPIFGREHPETSLFAWRIGLL